MVRPAGRTYFYPTLRRENFATDADARLADGHFGPFFADGRFRFSRAARQPATYSLNNFNQFFTLAAG